MGGGGGADSSEPLFPISYPLSPVFSYSCALSCTFLHFFALVKITTLFFSWDCALFDQKTGGRDILLTSRAYTEFAWRLLANLSSKSASVDSALSAAGTSPTGSGCQFRFFCFTFNFKLSTFDLPASHQSRVTSHFALYPAISRFCAKGHSRSIHCPSQRNPVRAAISGISSA